MPEQPTPMLTTDDLFELLDAAHQLPGYRTDVDHSKLIAATERARAVLELVDLNVKDVTGWRPTNVHGAVLLKVTDGGALWLMPSDRDVRLFPSTSAKSDTSKSGGETG